MGVEWEHARTVQRPSDTITIFHVWCRVWRGMQLRKYGDSDLYFFLTYLDTVGYSIPRDASFSGLFAWLFMKAANSTTTKQFGLP